jgi:hypothetical protein
MAYSYRCRNNPGRESCLGSFTSETEAELWKHIEMHASVAHQEDPKGWSYKDRQTMKKLFAVVY